MPFDAFHLTSIFGTKTIRALDKAEVPGFLYKRFISFSIEEPCTPLTFLRNMYGYGNLALRCDKMTTIKTTSTDFLLNFGSIDTYEFLWFLSISVPSVGTKEIWVDFLGERSNFRFMPKFIYRTLKYFAFVLCSKSSVIFWDRVL